MKSSIVVVVAALLAASSALGALGGTAGVVVPYAGKLEQNGAVVTGAFDFQFQVMPDAVTGTPCETKTVNAVAVTNGEFALTIPALSEGCVKGKDVHLIVGVRTAGGGGFTTLGKQRMTPTLAAMTSGTGDLNAGGQLQAASASIAGAVSAGGAVSGASLTTGGAITGSNVTTNSFTLNTGFMTINPTTGTFPWIVFAEGDGHLVFSTFGVGARRVSFHGNESGTIRSGGSILANSTPDIAETIAAAKGVAVADVVCADPNNAEHIVLCAPGAHGVLGVVSDGTSAFMINSRSRELEGPLNGQPLVLAGRVPVKVSLENGPIHIGDELTLSSVPGVAMRATGPGPVVGIALAAFEGRGDAKTRGTVLCFVKVSEGNVAALEQRVADLEAREKRIAEIEARLSALEPHIKQAALTPKELP